MTVLEGFTALQWVGLAAMGVVYAYGGYCYGWYRGRRDGIEEALDWIGEDTDDRPEL